MRKANLMLQLFTSDSYGGRVWPVYERHNIAMFEAMPIANTLIHSGIRLYRN
jgi:hypothetical protein